MQKPHVNRNSSEDFQPSDEQVRADLKTIRTFLKTQLQRDWFHLYANGPDDGRRSMRGYVAENIEDACDWIDRQQYHGRNIYFPINTPHRKLTKKAAKKELRDLWGYHLDWDLPKSMDRDTDEADELIEDAIARLEADDTLPGNPCIVMSGNGVQAYWFFAEPLRADDRNQGELETTNKRLALHFGAPLETFNSDRILRVPGTWNFPGRVKRERGCEPVLSRLIMGASRDFEPGDFTGLPKVAPVIIRASSDRRDYTADPYIDWSPFRWRDFISAVPDLPGRLQETLDGDDGNRSRALYRLIHDMLSFLVIEDGRTVEEMKDDRDIKKQIAELCWEGAEHNKVVAEVLGHVEDHEYERAQLGYEIGNAMSAAIAQDKKPTVRDAVRMKTRAETHRVNTAEEDAVTPAEAEVEFSKWFRNHVRREDLPEVEMQAEQTAKRQFATLTNIRAALRMAEVTVRWDAMRNEPRFFVDPEAGLKASRPERPHFNWERALSGSHGSFRARHEMRLILGALTGIGVVDKAGAEDMLCAIAYEKPYHPVEAYATARPWDGVDRIAQVAQCLTTSHPLALRYIQIHFYQQIGAVLSLRHFMTTQRGLPLDSTVVLCGAQNIGKSTFWSRITPIGFMSRGSSLNIGSYAEKDSKRNCLDGLVCTLNEIGQSLDRSDANALKDFQSQDLDVYRPAWAREDTVKPRMTAMCGTANQDFQLKDQTGSRRYLCLTVDRIDWEGVNRLSQPDELQQIYAQAWEAVMVDGRSWSLTAEEHAIREHENEAHREIPEEESRLADYLAAVGKSHVQAWLSMTQICKVLELRYVPGRLHILKRGMEAADIEYRAKIRDGARVYQKVFDFPVLPERLDEIRTLGR